MYHINPRGYWTDYCVYPSLLGAIAVLLCVIAVVVVVVVVVVAVVV